MYLYIFFWSQQWAGYLQIQKVELGLDSGVERVYFYDADGMVLLQFGKQMMVWFGNPYGAIDY